MLSGPTSTKFSFPKLRLSYQGTKNVAIYVFSSGKILDIRKIAGVKDMTNIMSVSILKLQCLYLAFSTLPTGEVGQKYYALKKSSPFVNSR